MLANCLLWLPQLVSNDKSPSVYQSSASVPFTDVIRAKSDWRKPLGRALKSNTMHKGAIG